MAAPAPAKQLSLEDAKQALAEVEAGFEVPENLEKMNKARAEAGNDIMKMMQIVAPVAMAIQAGVIEKWGYESNQQGVMQFSQAIKAHESDPDIAAGQSRLKAKFMPQPPSS